MLNYIDKIKNNIYFSHLCLICINIIIGYAITVIHDESIIMLFRIFSIIDILIIGSSIISIIENQKEQNIIIVILDLLLIIVAFATIFAIIYSFNPKSFEFSNQGIIYLDLLYFSFVTFTTLGYGDILPCTYLAKFTVSIEAFMFTCVIALIVMNFSERLKKYLAVYKDEY